MRSFFVFSFLLLSLGAVADVEQISLPTLDGKAKLGAQIDFPDGKGPFPLVMTVPGTGLFDRDAVLSHTGTERDYVFRDLAAALNKKGIATLRYDYRGVHPYDAKIRATVTPENQQSDILQLYELALRHGRIDAKRTAMFAHSEGTLNVARLVEKRKISPRGLVYMGMIGRAPSEVIHWQQVGRMMRVFTWGADPNRLTNDEIKAGWVKDPYFASLGYKVEMFLSPTGEWTRADFLQILEGQYAMMKADATAHKDADLLEMGGVAYASYRWWKQWFFDKTPGAAGLCHYAGTLIAHNGTNDSQTPGEIEIPAAEKALAKCPVKHRLSQHPGMGHTLSSASPLLGPIDLKMRDQIVDELSDLVER